MQNSVMGRHHHIAGVWCHGIGIPQWLTGAKHAICLMNMNEGEVKMVVFPPYIFDLCFNAKQFSLVLETTL